MNMKKEIKSHGVARAVLMAAGRGKRLSPLTDTTPKPLIAVKGKPIIATLIDALIGAKITEIYIVRGYRKEQFDALLYDYPMIKFIDNDGWESSNNISSIVLAGERVRNAYIMESDLYLVNPSLVTPSQYESNYLAVPSDSTDDWCFTLGEDGYINHIGIGGKNCQKMVGISYWTDEDGKKLAECAKKFYADEKNRQRFWDEVALDEFLDDFRVRVRECNSDDVIEIDTIEDLCAIDDSYKR